MFLIDIACSVYPSSCRFPVYYTVTHLLIYFQLLAVFTLCLKGLNVTNQSFCEKLQLKKVTLFKCSIEPGLLEGNQMHTKQTSKLQTNRFYPQVLICETLVLIFLMLWSLLNWLAKGSSDRQMVHPITCQVFNCQWWLLRWFFINKPSVQSG